MTRRPVARICALLLLLPAASCWFDSVAHEVDPLIPERPPTLEDWHQAAEQSGTAGAGVVPGEDAIEALALPELDQLPAVRGGSFEPAPAMLGLLPGGLRAATIEAGKDLAWIRLTVPNRALPASRAALALLTARLLAESAHPELEKGSLRQAVENVGGEIDVAADFRTTRFTIAIPQQSWRWILDRLIESIRNLPTAPEPITAEQERLVRDLTARYSDEPMAAAIERVAAFETAGPASWIATAQDLTPAQVVQFHHDAYRANGCILALRVPGVAPDQQLRAIRDATAPWTANEPRLLPDPVPTLPTAQGVFWADSTGQSDITLLFDVASTSAPSAAARLVALEVLTESGSGGRLGKALRDATNAPIEFEPRIVSNGVHRRLELHASVPADLVAVVQKACKDALRSCVQRPPDVAELTGAAARARLLVGIDMREPELWLDEVTRSLVGGARPDVIVDEKGQKPFQGEAPHPWLTVLQALQRPAEIDPAPVFKEWAARSPLILVVGGEPGDLAQAKDFTRMPDAFLPSAQREAIEASPAEQKQSGLEYLQRAIAAIGGKDTLAAVHGFHASGVIRSGRAPAVREQIWFRDDGSLRMVRRVLATTIETVVTPDRAVETAGGEKRPLGLEEVRPLLDEARRWPLMLLAEFARGDAEYRLVSIRPVGDRQMAVLERVADTPDRVRIEVDTGSGLIRAVVAGEKRDTGRVFLREEYRDYRTIDGGVRVPFYRASFVDGGVLGLATEWDAITAGAPTDAELQAASGS